MTKGWFGIIIVHAEFMQLFTTKYDQILKKVDSINPVKYAVTRNFKNGHVTKLSPYISRGVISTKFIYEKLVEKGFNKKMGARPLQRVIDKEIKRPLSRELLFGKLLKGGKVKVDVVNDELKVESIKEVVSEESRD